MNRAVGIVVVAGVRDTLVGVEVEYVLVVLVSRRSRRTSRPKVK